MDISLFFHYFLQNKDSSMRVLYHIEIHLPLMNSEKNILLLNIHNKRRKNKIHRRNTRSFLLPLSNDQEEEEKGSKRKKKREERQRMNKKKR
jgi:hypothetical protein